MDDTLLVLTIVAAIGCGLLAGIVYAFSSAIMKSLGLLPATQGIAAMQSINVTVINPWFMGAFFGPVPICVAVVVLSVLEWEEPAVFYQLAGSALYLVGAVLVTIAFNVPRNDALAAVDPKSADGETYWRRYLSEWTLWNHVRTAAALAAAALLTIALTQG
ncbi:MAG: DUF1772 domain-containing protein [Chloroflexi bacterium]|nr:DUF1772 domain-containing protein [Chloroflexota bacterium]